MLDTALPSLPPKVVTKTERNARLFLVLCLRFSPPKCLKNKTECSHFFWYSARDKLYMPGKLVQPLCPNFLAQPLRLNLSLERPSQKIHMRSKLVQPACLNFVVQPLCLNFPWDITEKNYTCEANGCDLHVSIFWCNLCVSIFPRLDGTAIARGYRMNGTEYDVAFLSALGKAFCCSSHFRTHRLHSLTEKG